MSSSNYRRNKAMCEQFRKELTAMMDDIREIDKKVDVYKRQGHP